MTWLPLIQVRRQKRGTLRLLVPQQQARALGESLASPQYLFPRGASWICTTDGEARYASQTLEEFPEAGLEVFCFVFRIPFSPPNNIDVCLKGRERESKRERERGRGWEIERGQRERERNNLPLTSSLPKWLLQPDLGQFETRSQEFHPVLPWVAGA